MAELNAMPSSELEAQFGAIDIYLFDQLLKGTFDQRPRILDAGCGGGRNLPYFLARGFEVFAIDTEPAAVSAMRSVMARLAPALSPDHVQLGDIDVLPLARRTCGRGDLQRRPALRPRRASFQSDDRRHVEGARASRVLLRQAGVEHWLRTRPAIDVGMDAAS